MLTRARAIKHLCDAVNRSGLPQGQSHWGGSSLNHSGTSGSVPTGLAHLVFRAFAQPATFEAAAPTAPASKAPAILESRSFLPTSRRSGVIAVKAGMTHDWDQWNVRIPLTVLWLDDVQVVQQKLAEREGYVALQLGCGSKREKNVHTAQIGHCRAAGVPLKRKYAEFHVTPDGMLPVGTQLNAAHFVPGQYVDIQGTTIGKGFQGVMKRWGFAGQPASHGNSLAHRAPGSIGGGQDPGRVFKGLKMAGRMGNRRRTVSCVWVYKVDAARNLLYVRGQVPGHKGNFVLVQDAILKSFKDQPERPFPTFLGSPPAGVSIAPASLSDPYAS